MCGIWAIFGSDQGAFKQCSECCMEIGHRGPDAVRIESINHFDKCCFGFHHLAVRDDLNGMQPFHLTTLPHYWLMLNGEIYNDKLLQEEFGLEFSTDSDAEVIVHLYDRFGIDFTVKHLDGVFSFILVDTRNRKVFIARDTFGVRPTFRLYLPGKFLAVCSEAKGLIGLLPESLQNGRKIEPFPPGNVEEYDLDTEQQAVLRRSERFHTIGEEPTYKTLSPPRVDDILTNVRNLLEAAVQKRMVSQRRIGCLLSGGLDSSLVSALTAKHLKESGQTVPLQTFSVGYEGSTDIKAARKVAEHIGSEHYEIQITHKEAIQAIEEVIKMTETYEVMLIRSAIAMYLMSKYISDKTDTIVIFSGEGADEVAQGYIYFHMAPDAEAADKDARRLLRDLYCHDVLRCDRATAAWGLELRVPFLDHEFTSYYLSLPPELRQPKNGMEKYLLRQAFSGTGLLPNEILWRPKEGFSDGISPPERSWFHVLQENMERIITDDMMKDVETKYPFNTPTTKESFYYRSLFEKYYPNQSHWLPYYWTPRWIGSTEASGRALQHYKNTNV